ncbi:MAG: formyltetrahydrofolate deformylase [Spirochaetes bacterium GWF1_51_8]|nr:MAG: formyltetrahydrofolate deformylase [Spirochaetes bacterium GWF1_51_8]
MNKEKPTAVLLLSCPDTRGIVAEVSRYIFENNGNIIHSDQHTDRETSTYFMRIEWELDGFRVPRGGIAASFDSIARMFKMNWSLHFSDCRPKIAVFVSKTDHCLYDLLLRIKSGELAADVVTVIANHEDLKTVADYFSIPFRCLPSDPANKSADEALTAGLMDEMGIDLIVLARYMQIIGEGLVGKYKNRIINIHHSFLPAFVGAKPYHQAYSRGVKIIGATSHYVTAELDQGPIIAQDVAQVSHRDSVEDLIRKGKNLEKNVLSRAVQLHLENKIVVFGNKTVIFD